MKQLFTLFWFLIMPFFYACDVTKDTTYEGLEAVEEIRDVLDWKLPASVRSIYFNKEGGLVFLAYTRCEMPRSEVDDFLNSDDRLPATNLSKQPVNFANYNTQNRHWWKPDGLKNPQYGKLIGDTGDWKWNCYVARGEKDADYSFLYILYVEER